MLQDTHMVTVIPSPVIFLTTATITHQVHLLPKSGWTQTQDDYRTVALPSARKPAPPQPQNTSHSSEKNQDDL